MWYFILKEKQLVFPAFFVPLDARKLQKLPYGRHVTTERLDSPECFHANPLKLPFIPLTLTSNIYSTEKALSVKNM